MKSETSLWISYADENLASAKVLLESCLYNPSLQNAQQAIEKYIKAYCIENGLKLQKTHNILSLVESLKEHSQSLSITEDEIDLIDSIYLSSKYPFGSVLPDFEPDSDICKKCIEIANLVEEDIKNIFNEEW